MNTKHTHPFLPKEVNSIKYLCEIFIKHEDKENSFENIISNV